MTDFYSVLQRAVASLPDGSGPQRRAVYDKARKALLKQLQSFDPPLPSADVTAQRLALEDAIRKIENEIARQIRTRRAVQTAIPAPAGNGARAAPSAAPGSASRAADAEREARRRAEVQRNREQASELLKSAVSSATLADPEAEAVETAALPVPVRRAEPHRAEYDDADEDEVLFEHEPEPHEISVRGRGRPVETGFEPGVVDGEFDEVDEDEAAEAAETADADDVSATSRREARRRQKEEERRLKAERRAARREHRGKKARAAPAAAEPRRKERAKRSFVARAALPLVLVVALVGAVYAAVTHRETILAVIDGLDTTAAPTGRQPITLTAGEPAASKNADRLPSSTVEGEETRTVTTTPWPPREGAATEDVGAAEDAGATEPVPETEAAADAGDAGADGDDPAVATAVDPAQFVGADEPSPAEEQVAAVDATATDPVDEEPSGPIADFTSTGRQTAVLYEEAAQAGEPGSAIAGSVEWSMVRQSVGGGDPEPIIRATAAVPNRDLNATFTVRENRDSALPASHLIEISFELPDGFAGGGVKSVPGIIMKETEQARGEALRGAAAKVSSGLFWIALSEDPNDRAMNLRLLKERDWIDIPILYENNRRAILTLRKGSDGFKSVNAAIQAWSPG